MRLWLQFKNNILEVYEAVKNKNRKIFMRNLQNVTVSLLRINEGETNLN